MELVIRKKEDQLNDCQRGVRQIEAEGGFREFIQKRYRNPSNSYDPIPRERQNYESFLSEVETICAHKNITERQWFEKNQGDLTHLLELAGVLKPGYVSRTGLHGRADD
jgi:hypothetical protein